jgi:hypothetical protein
LNHVLAKPSPQPQHEPARTIHPAVEPATRAKKVNLFDTKFLFASLLWGSIGVGYWIYGKKQQAMMPMIGGVVMVAVSYVVSSWWLMSLICVALMVVVHQLMKRGY